MTLFMTLCGAQLSHVGTGTWFVCSLTREQLTGPIQAPWNTLVASFHKSMLRACHSTGATVTPLHRDAVDYLQAHNVVTEGGIGWGLLTTDGFHPCSTDHPPCEPHTHGNYMIANAMARGLFQALHARVLR